MAIIRPYSVTVQYRGRDVQTIEVQATSPMAACEQAERTVASLCHRHYDLSGFCARKVECLERGN